MAHARTVRGSGALAAAPDLPQAVADPEQLQLRHTPVTGDSAVWHTRLTLDEQGCCLLATEVDGYVFVVDAESGTHLRRMEPVGSLSYGLSWVRRRTGESVLASADANGRLRLWSLSAALIGETPTNGRSRSFPLLEAVETPDGEVVVAHSTEDALGVWNLTTGAQLGSLAAQRGGTVSTVQWVPSEHGRPILVGAVDGASCTWDVLGGPDPQWAPADWSTGRGANVLIRDSERLHVLAEHSQGYALWTLGQDGCVPLESATFCVVAAGIARPDGRILLAVAEGGPSPVVLLDGRDGKELRRLDHGLSDVNALDMLDLPDGRLALVVGGSTGGTEDGVVQVWMTDAPDPVAARPADLSFTLQRVVDGHDGNVVSVAFEPPGAAAPRIASAGLGGSVRIWWADGDAAEPHRIELPTNLLVDVAWASDRTLAVVGDMPYCAVVDVERGVVAAELAEATTVVEAVDCVRVPGGELLVATGDQAGAVQVREVHTGAVRFDVPRRWDESPVRTVRCHVDRDGGLLVAVAVVGYGSGVALHRPGTGTTRLPLKSPDYGACLSRFFELPDGRLVIAAGGSRDVLAWDVRSGVELRRIAAGDHCRGVAAAVLADGRAVVVTAADAGPLRLWDLDTGALLQTLDGPSGVRCVDLADSPDGRLLLAAGVRDKLRLYATTPGVARTAGGRRAGWTVSGVEDRTPEEAQVERDTRSVSLTVTADAQVFVAAAGGDGVSGWDEEFDADTGDVLDGQSGEPVVPAIAWADPAHGPRWAFARSGGESMAGVIGRNPLDTGAHGVRSGLADPRAVAWVPSGDDPARFVLAGGGRVELWEAAGPSLVRALECPGDWGVTCRRKDERTVLATYGGGAAVTLWDLATGELLGSVAGPGGTVVRARFVRLPDGATVLAVAADSGSAQLVDADDGFVWCRLECGAGLADVSCLGLRDGRVLVATAAADGVVFWDGRSGARLHECVLAALGGVRAVDLVERGDGRVLLAAGGPGGLRLLDVRLVGAAEPARRGAASSVPSRVVALGAGGLWAPLGLVDDLVTLTGPGDPADVLNDERLGDLADRDGIARLRSLGWPDGARVAFAALLVAIQPVMARFVPPADTRPAEQRAALVEALPQVAGPPRPAGLDVVVLRNAVDAVTDRTHALLSIIGAAAATLDPLLPLRLAHRAAALPALTPAQLTLVSGPGETTRPHLAAGSTVRAAGSVGITRQGPLTTVLLTEHALPADLFTMRLAAGQLLHRHHPAAPRPPIRPVALVLDTTPPTFGQPAIVLRTIAHLLAEALWAGGHPAPLVTLTDPRRVRELAGPGDLPDLWTSRTLGDPDLRSAVATAAATGLPTVTLTVHWTALRHPPATPGRQLVTTHQPRRGPRHLPITPGCVHVPPDADAARLRAVVATVLAAVPARRTA